MRCSQVIPILRIFDARKAREFYVDWLGFTVDWEHRFADDLPLYMQVSRDGLVLHLSEHHGDACPGAKVYVRVDGLADYHARLIAAKYRYNRPGLGRTEWNTLCMEVIDPFGNRISFNEDIKP